MKTYSFDLDEHFEDLWHELEMVQDGKNTHVIKMDGKNKAEAATELTFRLYEFFYTRMEESEK